MGEWILLAMAPVFAWPVLFVTFLVLVRLLDQTHRQCATGRSRALGAFAVGALSWIPSKQAL